MNRARYAATASRSRSADGAGTWEGAEVSSVKFFMPRQRGSAFRSQNMQLMLQAQPALTWLCSTVLHMAKAARVLAALKRDGWIETRRSGSHRVLARGDQQRIWAYHDGVDLGGPAMARSPATTATPLLNCGSYRTIW